MYEKKVKKQREQIKKERRVELIWNNRVGVEMREEGERLKGKKIPFFVA